MVHLLMIQYFFGFDQRKQIYFIYLLVILFCFIESWKILKDNYLKKQMKEVRTSHFQL